MKRKIIMTVEIITDLPIEAVKEDLAMYCEKHGDVRVTKVGEKVQNERIEEPTEKKQA